jgi:hypothetical protein
MTPTVVRVKWEYAPSMLLLDSTTGVRYQPFTVVGV